MTIQRRMCNFEKLRLAAGYAAEAIRVPCHKTQIVRIQSKPEHQHLLKARGVNLKKCTLYYTGDCLALQIM